MSNLILLIVGVVFGLPLLILAGLFLVNRFSRGNTAKTINLLWLILALMLGGFLLFGVFTGAR